jgi:lysophospholipase L1-like esterase
MRSLLVIAVSVICLAGRVAAQTPAPAQPSVPAQSPVPAETAPPPPIPDCPDVARAVQDVMRNDARLRDWAQLNRYRMANGDLQRAGTKVTAVFLGDSITDSWSNEQYGGFFPNKDYLNRGISGQTTPQMLVRMKPDVLAFSPTIIVLLAGTNDIAGNTGPETDEEIQRNIAAIAELGAANNARIVLASVLPVSNYHVAPGAIAQTFRRPPARINTLNTWIKGYAAAHNHVYLDYFSAMIDDTGMLRAELSEDDLHPNARGYAIMGPLAEAAIAQALR